MRALLVCTSFCLVAFSSVGNPEQGVGAIAPDSSARVSFKGDLQIKNQSRFASRAADEAIVDWPVLLRSDIRHLELNEEQGIDEAAAADENDEEAVVDAVDADDAAHVSPTAVCSAIAEAAQANNIPVAFFLRLIWQESRFDAHAISRAGAQGVAQFMPDSAAEAGLQDPFDPMQALPASARMLSSLQARFGNLGLAAAAYNAGPKRIQDWLTRRARLPSETRSYVLKITGRAPELWKGATPRSLDLRIPDHVPCRDLPGTVQVDSDAVPLPVPAPYAKVALAHHGRHYIRLASASSEGGERRRRRH